MFSQQSPTKCSTTHAAPLAATVAPGFQMSIAINNLTEPTSVHFAPDGKVFITEKSGLILVYNSLTASRLPSLPICAQRSPMCGIAA